MKTLAQIAEMACTQNKQLVFFRDGAKGIKVTFIDGSLRFAQDKTHFHPNSKDYWAAVWEIDCAHPLPLVNPIVTRERLGFVCSHCERQVIPEKFMDVPPQLPEMPTGPSEKELVDETFQMGKPAPLLERAMAQVGMLPNAGTGLTGMPASHPLKNLVNDPKNIPEKKDARTHDELIKDGFVQSGPESYVKHYHR